jgi:sugar fermentation stimulation protein A
MVFEQKLVQGKLVRRYKRFLADVELENGEIVVAHCTNTGSMKSCIEIGAPVLLSPAKDPNRKTKFTWESIFINNAWIGINTNVPNKIVFDAIVNKQIKGLDVYDTVRREVTFEDSRLDVYAENKDEKCFIEVKNVTMKVGDAALFPDAKTSRGLKHLQTLIRIKEKGMRAVMVYIIQRIDVSSFGVAEDIDPDYAKGLKAAVEAGVEVFPLQVVVSPDSIEIGEILEFK